MLKAYFQGPELPELVNLLSQRLIALRYSLAVKRSMLWRLGCRLVPLRRVFGPSLRQHSSVQRHTYHEQHLDL